MMNDTAALNPPLALGKQFCSRNLRLSFVPVQGRTIRKIGACFLHPQDPTGMHLMSLTL